MFWQQRVLFHRRRPGEPEHAAALRDGEPYLRDADGAGRLKPGDERSRSRGCGELTHGTELEDRPEPHAGGRGGALVDRDDDLRATGQLRVPGVQRDFEILKVKLQLLGMDRLAISFWP